MLLIILVSVIQKQTQKWQIQVIVLREKNEKVDDVRLDVVAGEIEHMSHGLKDLIDSPHVGVSQSCPVSVALVVEVDIVHVLKYQTGWTPPQIYANLTVF